MLTTVIFSGGSGTRLWPSSRESRPKQLLAPTGQHTMLQADSTGWRPLVDAGKLLAADDNAMQLRYLSTLQELGATGNSTIVPLPVGLLDKLFGKKVA